MKKTLLFIALLMITSFSVKGQYPWITCTINFEDNPCWEGSYTFVNDPGPGNIWQVCTPGKTVFDSAWSTPRAILTDSTGPYPVNNTSGFIIKVTSSPWCFCGPILGGYYKFDSDTLKDFGQIEISQDNGTTWLNALSDTVIPDFLWVTPKPVLTGRIHQWRQFLAYLPFFFSANNDTLIYRFTFISDSIQTNQQGWMLDDLSVVDHIEGVVDQGLPDDIRIYPNPAASSISVSVNNSDGETDVSVYDIRGQLRLQQTTCKNNERIDISGLEKGVYLVKVISGNDAGAKMIIKE